MKIYNIFIDFSSFILVLFTTKIDNMTTTVDKASQGRELRPHISVQLIVQFQELKRKLYIHPDLYF